MKKKTYIHPSIQAITVEVQPLLAISGDKPHNEVNTNTTFGRSSTDDWNE